MVNRARGKRRPAPFPSGHWMLVIVMAASMLMIVLTAGPRP
jgi:hypothetical protein